MHKQLCLAFFIAIVVIASSTVNARGPLYNVGTDRGYGWREVDWFGIYFPTSSGWTYHIQHEWIYSSSESFNSIWYWSETNKWCWTNQTIYPWVWFHKEQSWKYFFKETGRWVLSGNSANSNDGSFFNSSNPPKTLKVSSASNLEMIWVEPGTSKLGTSGTSFPFLHTVTLTNGFYLGKYEVTQAQYERVMNGNTAGLSSTPSHFSGNPNRPVEKVSGHDIEIFLTRLTEAESTKLPNGWAYVLPTEAQWEYACRAGTRTDYSWGDSISPMNANFLDFGKWPVETKDVGQYSPNPWGFYDMHGNVGEFCVHDDYYPLHHNDPAYDGNLFTIDRYPFGYASGIDRGYYSRGGSWSQVADEARSVAHHIEFSDYGRTWVGFRPSLQKVSPTSLPLNSSKTWSVSSASDLEMIWVEPGTFMMGSPENESERDTDETLHQVTLTNGFYLGKYEVTQAQYERVMNAQRGNEFFISSSTPSHFTGNPNRPVENITWWSTWKFLHILNVLESDKLPEGWAYVLPTEAQWEYACRAGTTTAYSWGDSISPSDANYNYWNTAFPGHTQDVGLYNPNPWGFYDMHGNVSEWCEDSYGDYPKRSVTEPLGMSTDLGVQRGGGYVSDRDGGSYLRSASREARYHDIDHMSGGFRLSLQKRNYKMIQNYSGNPRYLTMNLDKVTSLNDSVHYQISVDNSSNSQASNDSEDNSGTSSNNSSTTSDSSNPPKTLTVSSASDLEMIWVEPGTFMMGSPDSEEGRGLGEYQLNVMLTNGFYLGKYEVTQTQWQKVMGSNPSGFKGADRPVEKVTWDEVTSFCERLTEMEREAGHLPAGMAYQLPNEAQWEYACRAGTTTAFSFGDELTAEDANFHGNVKETTDVGKYPANAWGFHDMHGNVLEWCANPYDWSNDFLDYIDIDPPGIINPNDSGDSIFRPVRGGCWALLANYARSAARDIPLEPAFSDFFLGFRLSLRPASK